MKRLPPFQFENQSPTLHKKWIILILHKKGKNDNKKACENTLLKLTLSISMSNLSIRELADTPPLVPCLFCRSLLPGSCPDDPVTPRIPETTGITRLSLAGKQNFSHCPSYLPPKTRSLISLFSPKASSHSFIVLFSPLKKNISLFFLSKPTKIKSN